MSKQKEIMDDVAMKFNRVRAIGEFLKTCESDLLSENTLSSTGQLLRSLMDEIEDQITYDLTNEELLPKNFKHPDQEALHE